MVKASIKLVDSGGQIQRKIVRALTERMNTVLDNVANSVVKPIRNIVNKSLISQPEVASLANGDLAAEFGLPDGLNRIQTIIDFWTSNVIVKKRRITTSGGRFSGGLTISMIRSDFSDVFRLNESTITTANGIELPWLQWLLMFGDQIIVRDYEVEFNPRGRSRSGEAIMVRSQRGWGVPPQFSGTVNANFVTRALAQAEPQIVGVIEKRLNQLT